MEYEHVRSMLPGVMQQTSVPGSPLEAILQCMVRMLQPTESALHQFPRHLNPRLADDRFVPMLAAWVDLKRLMGGREGQQVDWNRFWPTGIGCLRELIANAADLAKYRGTALGLNRFLELSTGLAGFTTTETVLDASGRVRPFHIRVTGPAEAAPFRGMIEQLIESEKPAHVTADFVLVNQN